MNHIIKAVTISNKVMNHLLTVLYMCIRTVIKYLI